MGKDETNEDGPELDAGSRRCRVIDWMTSIAFGRSDAVGSMQDSIRSAMS